MKTRIVLIFFFLLLFCIDGHASLSTEELAAGAKKGQEIFNAAIAERDRKVAQIMMGDTSKLPREKELAVRKVQNEFLKQSREIHLKYREAFIQRVIAETNAGLPEGKKIKPGLGSDIYLRDKKTGQIRLDKKGRKILNPKHRGMQGDLDLSGDGQAVKRLEETFGKYKSSYLPDAGEIDLSSRKVMTSSIMDGPGYRDFGDVEVTINIKGKSDLPGSSTHQTTVRMDAFSKETYVSFGMKPDQAGRNLVETNDHIKKAAKGFTTAPAGLLGAQGEKALQGMSKGTLKSIESGAVSDAQLSGILEKSGYQGDVKTFKRQIERLKRGHIYQGAGLNDQNIEAFQKACRKTTEQALGNAQLQYVRQKENVQAKIYDYEAKIKSGELSGDQLEKYKKDAQKLRNELVDSKVKIEETGLANKVKLEGGSYDDYYRKNALINVEPVSSVPKMTRAEAIKSGLKPGFLDVAGYGMTAYNIYDNLTKMQKGEISQNDAVIGVTKEVIDTGLGMITDVGTAAAVGTIGTGTTGAVATLGAPLVITAGAAYAVGEAVEEGLKTFEALKVEEIAEKIARSKKEEVFNTLQLQAEEMLKAGETTGDWRYFAKADNIADSLERMYKVTGDDDFKKIFNSVYNRVANKKEQLESKYNCSIYALKGKMNEIQKSGSATAGTAQSLQGMQIALSPFQISGNLGNTQGPAISGALQNGDVLEFLAEVEHPASVAPIATQLFWQVYDSGKRPVEGLNKIVPAYETGGKKSYLFRFRLDNMNNGDYIVALTHRLVSNPDIFTQAVFPFRIFQAVKIDRLLVTDGKNGQTSKTQMHPGDAPQMFVYYTLVENIGKVKVELTAKENSSGRVIESAVTERPRDGESPPYRVGLGLPAEALKAGDRVVFEARITTQDGKTQAANTFFSIVPEKYELKIVAPRMIVGDQVADYSLTLPEGFEPPFFVDVSGGALDIKKTNDPLRGKFQGPVTTTTQSFILTFLVRDAKNRTASGSTKVTVRGLDPDTISSRNQPEPVYVQPRQETPQASTTPAYSRDKTDGSDSYQQKLKDSMDAYTQEKIRVQQQQTAVPSYKPQAMPKPATPSWMSGGSQGGQGQKKTCRSFAVNASSCRNSFNGCMERCPKTGTHNTIQGCHSQCGNANRACMNAQCPGGKISGTGWNITCTICQ
jgi:hypothetical protein